jgi:tetratricopeptide (TPR) repeat protein
MPKLEKLYQDMLVKLYSYLAECYLQLCLLPEPAKEMFKDDVKKHKAEHAKEIQQALSYYDKALSFQPDNAALHFDKGVVLEWIIEFEKAQEEYKLAVQYQPRNPFYHKLLAPLYMVISFDQEKKEQHEELVKKYASSTFSQDYETWSYEFMSQKRKPIDPHSYTQQKGWFG